MKTTRLKLKLTRGEALYLWSLFIMELDKLCKAEYLSAEEIQKAGHLADIIELLGKWVEQTSDNKCHSRSIRQSLAIWISLFTDGMSQDAYSDSLLRRVRADLCGQLVQTSTIFKTYLSTHSTNF